MRHKLKVKWSFLSLFLLIIFFLLSSYGFSMELIENETCLDCHEDYDKTLEQTPHQVTNDKFNCVSCHGGAAEHIEDPSVDNIVNPMNSTGLEAFTNCIECHKPHTSLDNIGYDVHQNQEFSCNSCHAVHSNERKLLLDSEASFCIPCHQETKTKFSRRSNHPVMQGIMSCLDCHSFVKKQDHNLMYDLGQVCQSCHPEQSGPFLYEHEPVHGFFIEGSGCIECHDPHGSENDRLLRQKGNTLCQQCHIGHVSSNHGSQWALNWSKLSCQTCHTETHGSYDNRNYLDPNLEGIFGGNCYNSNCHGGTN